MKNNPLSASPDADVHEWECPYCEETRPTLPEIRDHITESADGDHRGVAGLKPTRDLVAFDSDGSEIDRIEGVSTEPADPLESYSKQEIIINSWLAAERDPDRQAVESISGATQQYVSKLLNELDSGEIPRETFTEVLDYGLKAELEERLENFDPEDDTTENMSGQTTATPEEIIEESSKKDRIIAAYRVNPAADKGDVADAIDAVYEYVRQIFNDIETDDPDEWVKLREGDLDDPDLELQDAVEQRLLDAGVLNDDSSDQEQSSTDTTPHPDDGMVPASEIVAVRDQIELLREQAEFTDKREAQFVAQKGVEWLDELIEQ